MLLAMMFKLVTPTGFPLAFLELKSLAMESKAKQRKKEINLGNDLRSCGTQLPIALRRARSIGNRSTVSGVVFFVVFFFVCFPSGWFREEISEFESVSASALSRASWLLNSFYKKSRR